MSSLRKDRSLREKPHFTVLLTSPDTNVLLVNAFREAARSAHIELKIVACDRRPRKSPASLLSDAAYELPPRGEEKYLQAIVDVCVVHRVDLVLPLSSHDAELLTRHRGSIENVGAALALCGPPLMIAAKRSRSARSKKTTIEMNAACSDQERSSQCFRIVLYFDRAGVLRTIIPCERLIEEGIEHLITRRNASIISSVRSSFDTIGSSRSIATLDAVLDHSGELIIEDIRHDLADTVEIAHKAGAPLVRWLLEEHAGHKVEAHNDWRAGVEMLRYSAAIYLLPVEEKSPPLARLG